MNKIPQFHCNLCDKKYSRSIEYEKHLLSFHHENKRRNLELKKINKQFSNESSGHEGSSNRESIFSLPDTQIEKQKDIGSSSSSKGFKPVFNVKKTDSVEKSQTAAVEDELYDPWFPSIINKERKQWN